MKLLSSLLRRILPASPGLLLALAFPSSPAMAQGFAAVVSPPRFEATARPGATYRDVIEISNVSNKSGRFFLHTADWQLDGSGSAVFSDALAGDSCRPWVGIEAPEISVPGGGKRRYRFEVAVPTETPAGECRFAIMIESDPTTAPGAVALPVSGRIAVIVYLTIGDARPQLDVAGTALEQREGQKLPVLSVRNLGNAHGRVDGMVDAIDAEGHHVAMVPSNGPILPGETRPVVLLPQADAPDRPTPVLRYPLRVKGRLEWGSQHFDLDTTLAP